MVLLTSRRHPADNAPAPPDWRTPSYCANLQAPRDTWVQLRTASLVEPTHHVSVFPHTDRDVRLHLFIPFFFLFLCRLSDLNKLSRLSVHLCSSFPADLESTIVCNCSNLTRAPTGNHGNSAPVCKNKTKVQQPLYYYCYCYYATFSNFFFFLPKAAFIFLFFFLC